MCGLAQGRGAVEGSPVMLSSLWLLRSVASVPQQAQAASTWHWVCDRQQHPRIWGRGGTLPLLPEDSRQLQKPDKHNTLWKLRPVPLLDSTTSPTATPPLTLLQGDAWLDARCPGLHVCPPEPATVWSWSSTPHLQQTGSPCSPIHAQALWLYLKHGPPPGVHGPDHTRATAGLG